MWQQMEDYYWTMAARGRLLQLHVDGQPTGLLTFFLLRNHADIPAFYTKPIWDCPPDYSDGSLAYIDKLLTHTWNRPLRHLVEEQLTTAYPYVIEAVWYRPRQGADIRYSSPRRVVHVTDVHG